MTKDDVIKQFAGYMHEHGQEQGSKLLARMLLGVAQLSGATEIEFRDEFGTVSVKSVDMDVQLKH